MNKNTKTKSANRSKKVVENVIQAIKKSVGRPRSFEFPTKGTFQISKLAKEVGVSAPAVFARVKKALAASQLVCVGSDERIGKGRRAAIYQVVTK